MTRHEVLDDPAREQAALHALDALPPEEAASYVSHLAACPACRAEVESLRQAAAGMALLAPAVPPSRDLRARLLGRLREEAGATGGLWPRRGPEGGGTRPTLSAAPIGGSLYSLAAESGWEETGAPGVRKRCLFVDEPNDRLTMLVRMAPGASYPSHRHRTDEECYVIEGDLSVGDVTMRAGDYKMSRTGSVDPVQATTGGCLLFIVSSLGDEILPDGPRA